MQPDTTLVETGTNLGSTACYLARRYPSNLVFSCEPSGEAYREAIRNARGLLNLRIARMESPDFLEKLYEGVLNDPGDHNLHFLDAHGHGFPWPLREEVEYLTGTLDGGFLIVDDLKVPGRPEFRHGSYDGATCDLSYIQNSLRPDRDYLLLYPDYEERTSDHHPLIGYGILEWGHAILRKSLGGDEKYKILEGRPDELAERSGKETDRG